MKKRLLAMLLVASMLLGLAACGAKEKSDAGDTSEHVVISYMFTGDKPEGAALDRLNEMMDKLNAILTEKVNAELELYFIGWTDYLANYNLTLAQMDGSVDLIGTASDWLDAWYPTIGKNPNLTRKVED